MVKEEDILFNNIEKQIQDSIKVKTEVMKRHTKTIRDIANRIIKAYKENKKVIWFGNGGSAADAQHLACELVSKFKLDRKPLSSLSLTTNTSILTAVSNDYDFERVFARQVDAMAENGDILVGITTSGTSQNIIRAFQAGREKGTINIAFTGNFVDEIQTIVDYIIDIPSSDTPRIQESHIMVGHIICDILEKKLFGDDVEWEAKQYLLTEMAP